MSTGSALAGGRSTSVSKPLSVGDIQMVLDRLDRIEESLQSKIDASIQSQEFTAKQLSDKIRNVEIAITQMHAKCEKVHGTRIQEIEDRIEQLEW